MKEKEKAARDFFIRTLPRRISCLTPVVGWRLAKKWADGEITHYPIAALAVVRREVPSWMQLTDQEMDWVRTALDGGELDDQIHPIACQEGGKWIDIEEAPPAASGTDYAILEPGETLADIGVGWGEEAL